MKKLLLALSLIGLFSLFTLNISGTVNKNTKSCKVNTDCEKLGKDYICEKNICVKDNGTNKTNNIKKDKNNNETNKFAGPRPFKRANSEIYNTK